MKNVLTRIIIFRQTLVMSLLILASFSCSGGGGSNAFDFLATSTEVPGPCGVLLATPANPGSTIRIAQTASSPTQVVVVPTDDSCTVSFTLNGASISSSGPSTTVNASMLNVGSNTLTATLSNSVSNISVSWTLLSNSVPVCSAPVPAVSGVAFNYSTLQTFTTNFSDADGDTVTASWLFQGVASPSQFTASQTATQKSAIFQAQVVNVGVGRTIGVSLNDGYDSVTCSWSVDIQDINVATVSSCTPSGTSPGSPLVITETGATSTQTLSATVSGTGVSNSTGVQWRMEPPGGSYANVAGQTNNVTNVTASTAPAVPGVYRFTIRATDSYNNTAECLFPIYVKSNDAPSFVGAASPSTNTALTAIRYNGGSTRDFTAGTSVSDANNDTITYTWSLDGIDIYSIQSGVKTTLTAEPRLSVNAGTPLTATYDALANATGLGNHIIKVKIDDGNENTSRTWFINPNLFSTDCNEVTAGQICTLVGYPGIGDGLDPTAVSSNNKVRIRPRGIVTHTVGGVDNLAFTDDVNHVVWYYNRGASSVDFFGKRIPAGRMRVILGSGTRFSSNVAPIVSSNPLKRNPSKIYTPVGIAVNATSATDPVIYVALFNNSRVVAINNSGITEFFTGNVDNSNGGTGARVIDAAGARCTNPYGVAYDQTSDKLFVSCYGSNTIRVVNAISSLSSSTTSDMIVQTGGTTVSGTPGVGGTARSFRPLMMKLERSGANLYVYWTEECTTGARRGGVVRAYVETGSANLTYGAAPTINAGQVGTVIGSTALVTNSCAFTAYGTAQNNIIIQSPADFFPATNGMYITDFAQDHVFYVNKNGTADTTTFGAWFNGGSGAPSRASVRVSGSAANQVNTNDSVAANTANHREPYGIALSSDGTTMFVSDNGFGRLRTFTLSSGNITTLAGSGNDRSGAVVTSLTPANGTPTAGTTAAPNVFLFEPSGLAIDNTNKKLYIGEYGNRRILELDLASGQVTPSVGTAATGSYNEDLSRLSTSIVATTSLAHSDIYNQLTYTSPITAPTITGRHLLFADASTTAGVGQPCLVRSTNLSSTSGGIFGTGNITLDNVRTIFGKLSGTANDGCTAVGTATNAAWFSSADASSVPVTTLVNNNGFLRSIALGISTDGTPALFVSLTEKNCIIKVSSNGAVAPVVGICNGGTGDSGTTAVVIDTTSNHLNAPKGIAIDPLNPTNLFVLDQTAAATSKLKYINFSGSTVSSALFGGSVAAGRILTLQQLAGTPVYTSIAANGAQVCISAGRNETHGIGENSVACYSRTNGAVTLWCGGDIDEYPNRDGSPLSDISLLEADGTTESYGYQEKQSCSPIASNNKGLVLLAGPTEMVFDSDGNLYIADRRNGIIRMVKAGW
jgi:hypothetical protein